MTRRLYLVWTLVGFFFVIHGATAQPLSGPDLGPVSVAGSEFDWSPVAVEPPGTLMITTTSLIDANLCDLKSYAESLSATGGDPSTYRWSAGPGLPPGFSLDPISGILVGSNYATATPKNYQFTVRVSDSEGDSASKSLSILLTTFDLDVESIKPVQVIYGEDLIQGKPTAFAATFGLTKCDVGVPTPTVGAQLTFEGQTLTTALDPSLFMPEGNDQVHFAAKWVFNQPFQPQGTGDEVVTATVNPPGPAHIVETNENNNLISPNVTILASQPLRLVYVPVSGVLSGGCFGEVSNSDLNNFVAQSSAFVKRTYPVTSVTATAGSSLLGPVPASSDTSLDGEIADAKHVAWFAFFSDPFFDKAVGVVPANYFSCHPGDYAKSAGLTLSHPASSVLVEPDTTAGIGSTTAHELGHAFGIEDNGMGKEGEEYDADAFGAEKGAPAEPGYWVEGSQPIDPSAPFYCFMGAGNDSVSWVDKPHYEFLMTLTTPGAAAQSSSVAAVPVSPQASAGAVTGPTPVIAISGILHANDQFEPDSWFFASSGRSETTSGGPYAIQILGASGNVLSSTNLDAKFMRFLDKQAGLQTVDRIPFFLRAPLPATAQTVKLVHGATVITVVDANIKLLTDAINSLPDCAFTATPAQYRAALLSDIQAIAAAENIGGAALQNAINNLSAHFQQWVTSTCSTSGTQLPPNAVSQLLTATSTRLVSGTRLPADVNGDGTVDCADVSIVVAAFGTRSSQSGFDGRADVNNDGVVDIRDLSFVARRLQAGTRCQ